MFATFRFHYGAYTCAACKVFFKRSQDKKVDFTCKVGGDICYPSKFGFTCNRCRLKRCYEIGMSKSRVKFGRYSKKKLKEIKTRIEAVDNREKTNIQFLTSFSDADDMLTTCMVAFSPLLNLNDIFVGREIFSITERKELLKGVNLSDFDEFTEIFEVTGVQMDNRHKIFEMVETFTMKVP